MITKAETDSGFSCAELVFVAYGNVLKIAEAPLGHPSKQEMKVTLFPFGVWLVTSTNWASVQWSFSPSWATKLT